MKSDSHKSPAFQFYAENFLGGTADMTAEEVGMYIRLLCHQWHRGGLPDNDKKLLQMSGGRKRQLQEVKKKFLLDEDGLLKNRRLEATRTEQIDFKQKKAIAGKNGAQKRWHGDDARESKNLTMSAEKDNSSNTSVYPAALSTFEIQHAIDNHQQFAEKFFSENGHAERGAIELQFKQPVTPQHAGLFNAHLLTETKYHKEYHEWQKHFRNYLLVQQKFPSKNNYSKTKNHANQKPAIPVWRKHQA